MIGSPDVRTLQVWDKQCGAASCASLVQQLVERLSILSIDVSRRVLSLNVNRRTRQEVFSMFFLRQYHRLLFFFKSLIRKLQRPAVFRHRSHDGIWRAIWHFGFDF